MIGIHSAFSVVLSWTHADLQKEPSDVFETYKKYISHPKYPKCIMKGKRVGRNFFDSVFTAGMGVLSTIMLRVSLSVVNAQPKIFHHSF